MRQWLRLVGSLGLLGVIFLQHEGECRAAETTQRGVSATVYGGAGALHEPNNESDEDTYDVERVGVGARGVWRFERDRPEPARYFYLAAAGTFELEASHRTQCGYTCPYRYQANPTSAQTDYTAKHFAARLGGGYSLPVFEFRLGLLTAQPDPGVSYAEPVWFPDVMARFGRRSVGWFELGIGAYDASTALRPGAYVGGALGSPREARVSAHLGLHFPNGVCCSTLPLFGLRGAVEVEHAVSDAFSLGFGGAVVGSVVLEGSLLASLSL